MKKSYLSTTLKAQKPEQHWLFRVLFIVFFSVILLNAQAQCPIVSASPTAQTFCSGGNTSIVLSSVPAGATFTWTKFSSGIAGSSAGAGFAINQTLTATGAIAGDVTYTITPFKVGCVYPSIIATVHVNPVPKFSPVPSSQTICSGDVTNISLTSNVLGTSFAWDVFQAGTSGASAGGGSTIAQTLNATTTDDGIATYHIQPSTAFCSGDSITVDVLVSALPDLTLGANPVVCVGTTSADLTYSSSGGSPDQYSVDFDLAAQAQGFVDVVNQVLPASPIVLVVPGGAAVGVYNAVLTVNNTINGCPGASYPITVTIETFPTATAGAALPNMCQGGTSVALGGSVGGSATGGIWDDGGVGGTFTPSATDLNATWTPPIAFNGSAILTLTTTGSACPADTDTKTQQVDIAATANAGSDDNVCAGSSYLLSGTMGGSATSVLWSTALGDGSFDDATLLAATYTPGPTDILNGTVTLTITPSGPGLCPVITDDIIITIDQAPTATAGAALANICQGGISAALGGSVGGSATGGIWSDGGVGGVFTLVPTDLNATWTPPVGFNGLATLTLTTTGSACPADTDTKTQQVDQAPTATAGAALANICQGGTSAALGGSVGGSATGGIWSDGGVGGVFTLVSTDLNATWTPPIGFNGLATLTLTTTGGACPADTDTKTQQVDQPPTATAGAALANICQGGISAALGGSVGGSATGGIWDDGGVGGVFTLSSTDLNAIWTPPIGFNGLATLTLTTTGGACPVDTDTKTQQVDIGPTATAGAALANICQGGISGALGGSVGGSATGGIWDDGGVGGVFTLSSTDLNATWTPPVGFNGLATLTLTTTGGACPADTD
ncbi:MAG: PKD-like domain-containing protein, partial [Bacteroidota bacterium]